MLGFGLGCLPLDTPCRAEGVRLKMAGVPPFQAETPVAVAMKHDTRRFARRQDRWFRRDPRITWIDIEANPMEALDRLMGEWAKCT